MINCGVGGFNTVREVEFFKEKNLLGYDPDMVIIGYNIHNMEIGHQFRGAKEKSDRKSKGQTSYVGPKTTFVPYHYMNMLRNSSVLLETVAARSEALLKTLGIRDYEPLYSDSSIGWTRANEALSALSEMAGQEDRPVMLIMFPVLSNLDDGYPFRNIHRIVAQAADSLGILSCDLFPCFEGYNARKLWIHPLDRHPNVEGHRIIAEGIYQEFLNRGIISVHESRLPDISVPE